MSIRPIDMQVAVQKTDHYIKDYNQNSQLLNSQQGTSVETQKQVLQRQRQVVSTQESLNKRINRDDSSGSNSNKHLTNNNKRHSQQKKNKDKNLLLEDDKGVFIDITL